MRRSYLLQYVEKGGKVSAMIDPIDRKVAFTLAEAGERTGLSPRTLRAQIKRGVIPATPMGKTYILRAEDLEVYLRDHAGEPQRANGARSTKQKHG